MGSFISKYFGIGKKIIVLTSHLEHMFENGSLRVIKRDGYSLIHIDYFTKNELTKMCLYWNTIPRGSLYVNYLSNVEFWEDECVIMGQCVERHKVKKIWARRNWNVLRYYVKMFVLWKKFIKRYYAPGLGKGYEYARLSFYEKYRYMFRCHNTLPFTLINNE